MESILASYMARLEAWRLDHFKAEFLVEDHPDLSQKFHPSGAAKPFHGLTVVTFIDPESMLYQALCDYQNRIRTALKQAGLEAIFSFLDPKSFHMTLCDIVAGPDPVPTQQTARILQAAGRCFPSIGKIPDLSGTLSGLGVDASLLLLVQFEETALKACLDIEHLLKEGLGVDERSFLGHVSLAYFVQVPGSVLQQIKCVLDPFKGESLGQFPITKIDLCYFRDMHSYQPRMTFDLRDGSFAISRDYLSSRSQNKKAH